MSRPRNIAKTRAAGSKAPKPKSVGTGASLSGNGPKALLCVLLAGVTMALYSPVLGHSFVVYDDEGYVTANPHIHDGLAWSTVKWAFTTTQEEHWHPLTWLSHALDYQLFALNPAGHHLDSLLIHAVNCRALIPGVGVGYKTSAPEPAGGGAVRGASDQC